MTSSQPEISAEAGLLEQVRHIWEAQRQAHAGEPGALERFFALLAPELEWTFPLGKYAGTHQGRASYEEFFRYALDFYPTGLFYHFEKIYPLDDHTAAVEFNDEGFTRTGNPYKAEVTIQYGVRDGKLVKYVEQFRSQHKGQSADSLKS